MRRILASEIRKANTLAGTDIRSFSHSNYPKFHATIEFMITPSEILAKANRLYPQAITAWLEGQSDFLPRRLPANLHIAKHPPQSDVIRQVSLLRDGSKAQLGYGYTVLFEQVASRSHGDNIIYSDWRRDNFFTALKSLIPANARRVGIEPVGQRWRCSAIAASKKEEAGSLPSLPSRSLPSSGRSSLVSGVRSFSCFVRGCR